MKGFSLIFYTLIIDQISKILTVYCFTNSPDPIKINDFLNIMLVFNNGISFGMFSHFIYSKYLFSIISIAIVCFLLKWLKNSDILWEKLSLGLIIGGAIGNILDRILYGAVVDFIQLHWKEYYWPSFNIADSAICIGVFILAILNLQKNKLSIESKK